MTTIGGYDTLAYGHSQHRRFVKGCPHCLKRTQDAQRRYTESKARTRDDASCLDIREWVWLQTIAADIAAVLDEQGALDTAWPFGVVLFHSLAEE